MSLSIAGIGTIQPIYAPSGPIAYAQNQVVADSVAATTAGAETGAASVVYEPSASEGDQQLTYSNRETANRSAALLAASIAGAPVSAFAGDEAVVAATGGAVLPPPQLPETPHSADVRQLAHNVWAPVRPVMADPVMGTAAASAAPVQPNQAEASAQASYAAVVDAMIVGASLADLEKFA